MKKSFKIGAGLTRDRLAGILQKVRGKVTEIQIGVKDFHHAFNALMRIDTPRVTLDVPKGLNWRISDKVPAGTICVVSERKKHG